VWKWKEIQKMPLAGINNLIVKFESNTIISMHRGILNSFIYVCMIAYLAVSIGNIYADEPWVFKVGQTNLNRSDWNGLNEDQVYFRTLTHTQSGKNWTIKVGKGGQFYSISTPKTGELIARQRATHGQWMDEVYQHTVPMPPQKDENTRVVDGDIHQAGYYVRGDLDGNQMISESVYSPLFAPHINSEENSFQYIVWPQHAHLPRTYSENKLLMNQIVRDLGDGVIEVTIELSKWGGRQIEMVSAPWAAFRTATVPYVAISDSNGGYEFSKQIFNESIPRKLSDPNVGGWIAYVQNTNKESYGIGIVYGKQNILDGRSSFVRWGDYDTPELDGVDGTILSVKRDIDFNTGERLHIKYYLIIGTLADIQVKANAFVDKVEINKEKPSVEMAGRIKICKDETGSIRRGCLDDNKPIFSTFRNYVSGSVPLFLIRDMMKNKSIITSNPYYVSFDPTDKKTDYQNFLGWSTSTLSEPVREEKIMLSQIVNESFPNMEVDVNDAQLIVLQDNSSELSQQVSGIFLYNDLVRNYGKSGTQGWVKSDVDMNGVVDKADLDLILEEFKN
jgi:hypothetical protein